MAGPQQSGDPEMLRLDYEQTVLIWQYLVDLRFKVLLFTAGLSGAGVSYLASQEASAISALAAATAGLFTAALGLYDLRNSTHRDVAVRRAIFLEEKLGFPAVDDGSSNGGFFTERPGQLKPRWLPSLGRDRIVRVIFAASVAGWAGIAAYGLASPRLRQSVASAAVVIAAIGVGAAYLRLLVVYHDARVGGVR